MKKLALFGLLVLIAMSLGAQAIPVVFPPPTFNAAQVGVPYSQTLTASGGVPPYKWMQLGLPDGLHLSSATGIISGTPTTAGNYRVDIQVADSQKPKADRVQRHATLVVQ